METHLAWSRVSHSSRLVTESRGLLFTIALIWFQCHRERVLKVLLRRNCQFWCLPSLSEVDHVNRASLKQNHFIALLLWEVFKSDLQPCRDSCSILLLVLKSPDDQPLSKNVSLDPLLMASLSVEVSPFCLTRGLAFFEEWWVAIIVMNSYWVHIVPSTDSTYRPYVRFFHSTGRA